VTLLAHLGLALLLWLTSFGMLALAWKGRLPMEIAILAYAVILLVALGSPLAVSA
jgi:hypothetical protein